MSLFRKESLDSSNKLSGDVSITQLIPLSILTYIILFVVLTVSLYLISSSHTKKATVHGYVFPFGGYTKIHTQMSGILSDIYVSEGEFVTEGQQLFRVVENTSMGNLSKYHEVITSNLESIIINIREQLESENTLLNNLLSQIEYDIDLLNEEISTLRSQQNLFLTRVKINEEVVNDFENLAEKGHVSRLDLSVQRYGLLSLYQTGIAVDSQILSLTRQLSDRKNQKEINILESNRRITDLQNRLHDVRNQLASAKFSSENLVTAPRAGNITNITFAEGNMVNQGSVLLNILPPDPNLHGIVYVPTSSIGFMQVGQGVRVRVRAFPYQRFGSLSGSVVEVADVATNYDHHFDVSIPELSYRVIIKLDDSRVFAYGRTYDIRLGMEIDADVMLDERSLMQWLFEPILSLRGML